jgi:hypothetical protein
MLNKNQIEIIKKSKRLKLNKGSYVLKHYYIALIPLLFALFLILDEPQRIESVVVWILIVLSLFFFFIQRNKLNFKEFNANCSFDDLREAFRRTSSELNWQTKSNNNEFLSATFSDPFHHQNIITIIPLKKGFLINSISDPREPVVPLIKTWDKENIRTFVKHLKHTINNIPENKDYLNPEKQWTKKKIIGRLILYPFWLIIISLSIYMLINPIWFKSIFAGILGFSFGVGYFISDIRNIIKRKEYERTTKL